MTTYIFEGLPQSKTVPNIQPKRVITGFQEDVGKSRMAHIQGGPLP